MSLPRYSKYKDSGVEWLGEIPQHWCAKKLKRSVRLISEKATERHSPIALENIESWTGRFIPSDIEYSGEGTAFNSGDLLFGKLRPYLAKAYFADAIGEAVGDFHVLRPNSEIFGRYLQYLILNRDVISMLDGSTYGAKMPRVGWEFMGNMMFPIPPIEEQVAICSVIDAETTKIDSLVEEQQRLIGLLKEKRQAVISHAVTKGLNPDAPMKDSGIEWIGKVPKHWEILRLGTVFREIADSGSDGLPILCVSIHNGVSDRQLDEDEMDRKITRSDDISKYKVVAPGDLVYNMMRAWQGGFGAVTVPGLVSPAYVVARPKRKLETAFVEMLLRTAQAVEEMRRHSHGVTDFRLRLYWDDFKCLCVALPPESEQVSIIRFIEEEAQKIDLLVSECNGNIDLLQERRTALISAAVTGKIDVRGIVGD
jgi:type I restriction enzyme S subunit